MEEYVFKKFIEKFGSDPEDYLGNIEFQKLKELESLLEIEFMPPFDKDESEDHVRKSIISVIIGDFCTPPGEQMIIDALQEVLK